MAEGAAPSDGHGVFPSNLGQDNIAQEIKSRETLQDAHGREEHMLVMDPPPSSSTKSLGKAIQAYDEHDGAASSTKLIPKANADTMTHSDMDDPLKSTPVPKKNQPPKILSYLNDTRDHSLSRDEGREHDPRASNYGHDNNTHPGESSTNRSTGVVRDGITSPCARRELAKGTAAASTSMKSVIQVDPSTEEIINSLGGPLSSMPSPAKAVQDEYGSEEHTLAVRRPPSSWTKSLGKAIEGMLNSIASSYRVTDGYLVEPAYNHEHDEAASSTKIIPKVIAAAACLVQMQPDAGPSVGAPAQHHDGVVAAIGGPAQANASDVASNTAPAIPAFAQHDVNVAIAAIGGGGGGAGPAAAQPNAVRQVPSPAQINGEGVAVIAAPPAAAQAHAGGPAPNAALPVPVLNPNPGVHNIDAALTNSGILPLRNPADGDKGKIWDKLN